MNKKQFIFPFLVLLLGGAGYWGMASMKKPPAEKALIDNTPLVTVQKNHPVEMNFSVSSYGVVSAKYETELVAQVSGEVVYLSEKFVRGGFVKKGDLLAKIDASDYDVALIEAQANIASAEAALVLERAYGDVAKEQWSNITRSKPTALSLRKPQLAQEEARLLSAQATLKRAKKNRQRTQIKAPYNALIESRKVGLGSYVSMGTSLGKIFSTAQAEIRLPVADHELQYLTNQGVGEKVTVFAKLAGVEQQWNGKIIRTEGVIDQRSRMNYLVAEIKDPYALLSNKKVSKENSKNELRYGTYVTALINGREAGEISIIPRHLLLDGKVAIVNELQQLHFQEVSVARTVGAQLFINQGLKEGELVITSALDYPIEGMPVQIINKQPTNDVNKKQTVQKD